MKFTFTRTPLKGFAYLVVLLVVIPPNVSLITSFLPHAIQRPTTFQTGSTYSQSFTMSYRAWTCHGKTNREMVEKLAKVILAQEILMPLFVSRIKMAFLTLHSWWHYQAGIIKSTPVKEALLKVDRNNYSNDPQRSYTDAPQPIGNGQTISAPHMHAHALEEVLPALVKISQMSPRRELKILDVGKCQWKILIFFMVATIF